MSASVVVHQVGEGPGTWAMGSLFEHLVTAEHTGGTLGMSLVTQPPGIATPLHRHTREAEALGLYDEVGVPAAGMHVPGDGEGLTMAEEITRWNEVGPRFGLEVVGPPLPV